MLLKSKTSDFNTQDTTSKTDSNSLEERHITHAADEQYKKDLDCFASIIYLYIVKYETGYKIIGLLAAG